MCRCPEPCLIDGCTGVLVRRECCGFFSRCDVCGALFSPNGLYVGGRNVSQN